MNSCLEFNILIENMFNSEKPIIQIAYSSKDIISEAKKWSKQFNIGPFYINEHIKVYEARINGIKGTFDHSSAYGWKENMMIELINDHSGISPYKNGIHHVAWIADNFDEENKILQNQNCKEVLYARAGDKNGIKFSWFDPGEKIGHFYEIYENNENIKNF